MNQTAVSGIWRAFGLQPHRTESFKLSPEPQFIDKVRDIVGLSLTAPEVAAVLCVDEKSQIQALDRTASLAAFARGARTTYPPLPPLRHRQLAQPGGTVVRRTQE